MHPFCVTFVPGGDSQSQRAPAPRRWHLRHHEPGICRQVILYLCVCVVYVEGRAARPLNAPRLSSHFAHSSHVGMAGVMASMD